jgi:hypothetical protein
MNVKFLQGVLLLALLVARVEASSLSFTLSPAVEDGQATTFPVTVPFSGTLTDTDTADTCDSENVDCLYLNFITFSFDQSTATSNLSGNIDEFYINVPGVLSDDGIFNSYTGTIFGITIEPDTPLGDYTGTVSVYGGYDSQTADNLLATDSWTVVVAPEPAAFGLAIAGLAAIVLAKRRASA